MIPMHAQNTHLPHAVIGILQINCKHHNVRRICMESALIFDAYDPVVFLVYWLCFSRCCCHPIKALPAVEPAVVLKLLQWVCLI